MKISWISWNFMNFMNYGCIFWDEHEPKITKSWILAMNIDRIHWDRSGPKAPPGSLPQAQDLKSTSVTRNERNEKDVENRRKGNDKVSTSQALQNSTWIKLWRSR
jgi:hypothetical protein